MGLIDFFRSFRAPPGSDPEDSPESGPQRHRKLGKAWKALDSGNLDSAISLAGKHEKASDPRLKLESKKVTALALFKKENYAAAIPLFEEIAAFHDDTESWFNIVSSATLAGETALGEKAFQEALRCQEASGYSQQPGVPFLHYYYACALRDRGEFRKALPQIGELRTLYRQLKITDDHFLYARGVPFLSLAVELMVDVFRGIGASFDADRWLEDFATDLDDEGRAYLETVRANLAGE